MEVRQVTQDEAFDLPVWRELLAADPNRHVFSTPEWNRLWWQAFGPGQAALFLAFFDPEPVALAALTIDKTEHGRRLRFMGGDDLTDYQGPIIAGEEHRRGVAGALLTYLMEEGPGSSGGDEGAQEDGRGSSGGAGGVPRLGGSEGAREEGPGSSGGAGGVPRLGGSRGASPRLEWDYLEAACLPVPFGFSEWLVEAADRLGMSYKVELHELTAVLALPGSWDGYLAGLGKKRRHELERKIRKFEREAAGAVLRTSDAGHLEADLEAFVALHKTSEGDKGEFMLPARADFFAKVARRLHPIGMFSLDYFELDGKMIAATYSFKYDGVFYLYNSAYDLTLRPISPGLILVARLIERSVAKGYRRFDFLRGRERYKYDLGAEALPLHSVTIRRNPT